MIEVSSHHERLPSSTKPTVFVVDDDAAVLGSLRFLLETDGFAVRTFRSGTALLNAGGAPGADCYVIDYKMPDINGIELASRLRKSDGETPVILITGYPDENISTRAAAAGVKDVVLKPLLDENLLKRIRRAIQDRPRA
ncbi:two-component system response regulator FixJ [Bradyrhizobium diazoefficiens]|jgi:two-component system, LuxR family, response regulator FixJ|uniref:Two-component response regulator n=4 Tax=Bradyrhizobium TaxID=374 RepID=H7C7U3_BRADU|nr:MULTISPECIES: response regulator [Bradyrhizobium]MBP1067302.1 FixJ family two-component response regulator [Bradyrhizobium japonicum]AND88234.1 chemotaxis protein CheY [Bradyrhizobium diazoefficiens USDA 110]APO55204.1 two-component system response regulator [Bradyrhizobium diazoefficiens]AWO89776.1 response regulator [Bradyrhizobium diazoefficiens]KGJ68301.1 putative Transcriptional regulatory protein fixJ [Bradyrhizobium diazoefficiens SEMIA 5080]